tara:strand:- start:2018 stop:2248 length:231 start_codon:yes stop_codon:yes gene_type:complete
MPMNNVDLTSASPAGMMSDAPDGKPTPEKLESWGTAGIKGGEINYSFTQAVDAPKKMSQPAMTPNFNSMADSAGFK